MNAQRAAVTAPLIATRFGRAIVAALCISLVWATAQAVPHPAGLRGVSSWALVALYLFIFPIITLRPQLRLILVAGGLAVAMELITPNGPANLAAVGAIAIAGGRLAPVRGRWVAGLIGFGTLGALAISTRHPSWGAVFSLITTELFTYIAAASVGQLRHEQRRTSALLEEVLEGRDAQVRAAALDERARLAREVHDVLAHTLSALSIQLEGAWLLAEQRGCDPSIVSTLDRVSRLAKEGLLEARRAVSSLRGESPPGPDLLPALVESFERDSGTTATLRVEGQARELPPEARLALYRTAQEALTNIRKHADATAVGVTLRYEQGAVELLVENQGGSRATPLPGSGYGLIGLRERAELLGGRLEAGLLSDGYRVRMWIPV